MIDNSKQLNIHVFGFPGEGNEYNGGKIYYKILVK